MLLKISILFLLVNVYVATGTEKNDTAKEETKPTTPQVVYTVKRTTNETKKTPTQKTTSVAGSTAKPTLAPKPKVNCTVSTTCGKCSDDYHCYWCGPQKQCQRYPSGRIIPKGCPKNDWYWKQCFIPGYVLIIVIPVVIGLFLLCCGCCIYCKCCRTSTKSWKKEEERITARRQERQMKAEERKSERKKTTDALRMKYGLLKSDDEEQLIS